MSGLLKLLMVGGSLWVFTLVICFTNHLWFLFVILILIGICVAVNFSLYKKIKNNVNQMNATGTIRNVDFLIIGEYIDVHSLVDDSSSVFAVLSPERSLQASKEILRHTFSILRDGGTVIITNKKGVINDYTCFDTMWFHDITIKRLGLKTKKILNKFPLFVEPVKSICLLMRADNKGKKINKMSCPDSEISEFCSKRGLNFKYYQIEKRSK